MTSAKIIADSLGHSRLTTFEIEFPRFLQAELNTHKQLAKNSASSRAIPVEKQLERVANGPFVPQWWGANQKGMTAEQCISDPLIKGALDAWALSCSQGIQSAETIRQV